MILNYEHGLHPGDTMKYQDLIDFLENKMRLSHIYQPLLIKSLTESGGSATIRQLANAFLSQDESQLQYYEHRIKQMPRRVLRNHDVVSKDGDLVSLKVTYQWIMPIQPITVFTACPKCSMLNNK